MGDWAILLRSPVRRVLDAMLAGSSTLSELSRETGASKSAILPHLKALAALGIVHHERVPTSTGSEARYRLRDASLHISFDAGGGRVIAWGTLGRWSTEFPLLGQIPQPEIREEIGLFLRALRDAAGASAAKLVVIAFGSASRGDATWKSEIDLFVLVERRSAALAKAVERATVEAAAASQHAFQPLVIGRDEWPVSKKRVVLEAYREGIVVWAPRGENAPWSTMSRYASISL